jgi:uncharacterized protein
MSDPNPDHHPVGWQEPGALTVPSDGASERQLPTEGRWGLGDAVAGLVGGYALATLLGVLWFSVTGDSTVGWGLTVVTTLGLWLGMAGVPVLASRAKGTGDLGRDFGWRIDLKADVWTGLGLALLAQGIVLALSIAVQVFAPDVEVSQSSQDMAAGTHGARLAVLVVIFAVGAPLVEELFFRGLLLRALWRRFGSGAAVALSGLVFGFVHLEAGDPVGAIVVVGGLTVFGWVLAWITVKKGRIGPALVAHMAFNAVGVVSLLLTR